MLMMRPRRAFIMPRSTALLRRNTEPRFVAMTASQSSGFMRSSSVSRVMPALLTRMRHRALRSPRCRRSRLRRRRRRHVEDDAAPAMPADFSASSMAATPALPVAVPIDGGSGRAERERDGAADAARGTGDEGDLALQRLRGHGADPPLAAASAASSVSGDSMACSVKVAPARRTTREARQHLARPALDTASWRPRPSSRPR